VKFTQPAFTDTAAGRLLRNARETRGLTIHHAAGLLDVTAIQLCSIERGRLVLERPGDYAEVLRLYDRGALAVALRSGTDRMAERLA